MDTILSYAARSDERFETVLKDYRTAPDAEVIELFREFGDTYPLSLYWQIVDILEDRGLSDIQSWAESQGLGFSTERGNS